MFPNEVLLDICLDMASNHFAHLDLSNADARMKLSPEQKREIVEFMVRFGLQLGLRPSPSWQRKK